MRRSALLLPALCAVGAPASAASVQAGISVSVTVPGSCRIEARPDEPLVAVDVACGLSTANPPAASRDSLETVRKAFEPAPSVTIEEMTETRSSGTRQISVRATVIF
jgi:hypothetical protein